jgi:hypothetical protein
MGYLTRNKIYEKNEPSKDAKKIYIICEGKKESKYFDFFKGISSNIDIIPIPSEDGKTDPLKLKNLVIESIENGLIVIQEELLDEIWFIIDTDRWNEGNKINELKSFVKEKNSLYIGWFVAQSNPSFEIWLYYHLYSQKPNQKDVLDYSSFKEYVNEKIKGGFDIRKMPVEIQQATLNATNNYEIQYNQPILYSTEVFILAQKIIAFTKDQLDDMILEKLRYNN